MADIKIRERKYRTIMNAKFWYGGDPYVLDSWSATKKIRERRRRELRNRGYGTRVLDKGRGTTDFVGMVGIPSSNGRTYILYVTVGKPWRKR
jgi:hypothetical protein